VSLCMEKQMTSPETQVLPDQQAEQRTGLDASGRLSGTGQLRVRAWHLRFLLGHQHGQRQATIEAELADVEAQLAQGERDRD
jgi:endonuclease/exonuclease/phosphatase family metal-dependent hydrolase